jgi:hypothetical protein
MKPTKLPTLKIKQRNDGLRVVLYWVLVYGIAALVVLLDCIVWRP